MDHKIVKNTHCEDCSVVHKSLFCNLELKAFSQINHHKTCSIYLKGAKLFTEGNTPFGLFCISEGKIKLIKVGEKGKESILRIVGPGNIIGHRSLFAHEHYRATAIILEDAKICFIGKKQIFDLVKENTLISLKIIEILSQEMGEAENKATMLFHKNVRERFAELLLTLNEAFGIQSGNRYELEIKLTREEMASMIGATSETVIRQFKEFKEEKILELDRKKIFLLNLAKLTEVANLSY